MFRQKDKSRRGSRTGQLSAKVDTSHRTTGSWVLETRGTAVPGRQGSGEGCPSDTRWQDGSPLESEGECPYLVGVGSGVGGKTGVGKRFVCLEFVVGPGRVSE